MTGKRAEAAASVFIERFSGMVILFLLTIIALFYAKAASFGCLDEYQPVYCSDSKSWG